MLGTSSSQLTAGLAEVDAYWIGQPLTRIWLDIGWAWDTWHGLTLTADRLDVWLDGDPMREQT